MKTAIILTSISILCIFGIAIFYPMYRKRREQKKLQAWRDELYRGDICETAHGIMCQLMTTPDLNGDCKIHTEYGSIQYTNIDKLYPEGGENGTGS